MLIFSGKLDPPTADVSITVFDLSTGRETTLEEHPKHRPLNIQNCLCWGWGDDPPEWAKTLAAAILKYVLGDELALERAAEFASDVLRQLPPTWSLTDDQISAWVEANHVQSIKAGIGLSRG
jgi:hypothetical protein